MRSKRTLSEQKSSGLNTSLLAAVISTTLAGCVVAPEDGSSGDNATPENSEEGPSGETANERGFIATSYTTSTELGVDLEINIRPLELLNNESLKLSMEVTNNSGSGYVLADALSDPENLYSASNTTLIDPASQNRHLNNELGDGSCYCTFTEGTLASGDSVDLEVMFPAPPEETESMTVTTPVTSPFFDIPITDTSESIDEDYNEGEILPLTMISDDEGDTGRSEQESEDEISILLSSDVLFDFDSSELTSDSNEIIEQVASEIDQSNSDTVDIEGHTDDQGSDTVNLPLSEERADSVESALSELVNRDDITFETEGHGSSDPVADNDTEEGQELNRRVTVTFAK
ncbi:OmpA family protein [Nocardiopsis xinjiangensis]|uniref:OmpA family protein n=1 Tax=Nocardiopsis xinjiangensis TaxID=124285 RepID=UPI001267D032|nr:OmpA family protein [Nocardiopsis xinjiangensis]